MSYATPADLIAWCGMHGVDELTELTDPTNTALDAVLVADKLQQADTEIQARLPNLSVAAPYPRLLVDTACRIARYLLYANGRPEWVVADYQSALQFLDDVRLGKASLGLAAAPSGACPVVTARAAVFTADALAAL